MELFKHTLIVVAALLMGCINHKDLAQISADAAEYCTEQEKIAKIEDLTMQMANMRSKETLIVLSRVECALTETRGTVSIYNCDGYAINPLDYTTHMVPFSTVVDNEYLIILDLRGL